MMNMSIRENIRKEIAKLGYGTNLTKFCRDKGLNVAYLNQFLNGKRRYNEDLINKIAKALNIPAYQLLADEPLIPYSQIKKHTEPPEAVDLIKFFLEPLPLGPGVEISDFPPNDYIPFPKKWLPKGYKSDPDRIVSFPTTGISMKPTIMPGSIVWIDRMDVQPREGEIYAFWLERTNAVTIKRLIKISRGRYCIIDGDNRNEEDRKSDDLKDFPMVIDCKEHEDGDHPWPIRGRVIWVLNRFIEEPKK
ncbi:MAG: S24 family peptidase [Clostridiales bacterium]|jgi:transcriptional regulator with XRE-family HTH domain|nr:S24 family peptidase [Clostridiales bacterium]